MKKTLITFIIIFFLFGSNTSKAQWRYYCYFDLNPFSSIIGTFSGADFVNSDTGIYCFNHFLSPSSGYASVIMKTNNKGTSWSNSFSFGQGSSIKPFSVRRKRTFYCIENENGISPNGVTGTLLKSSDGGVSWIYLYSKEHAQFFGFSAPDTSEFYFLCSTLTSVSLAKYKNGIFSDSVVDLTAMEPVGLFFPDTTVGYAYGIHRIFKTINGGTNWNQVFYDSTRRVKDMFFTNTSIGYVVCDSGRIIKTIDGGTNWQNINSGGTMNSIFFINDSVGFAAGDYGVIIRTSNGGINWNSDTTTTQTAFIKIFFVNDSIGFAIVDHSMYTINLRAPTAIWELVNKQQFNFICYPNPTTGKFFIEIPEVFKQEEVLFLTLYDYLGQMAEQRRILMRDQKVDLDISSKPKGFYFMTLSNGTKYINGKIILE